MPQTITVAAPAKINLFLRVKGRRPDGYHEIESLMQKLELADSLQLTLRSERGVAIHCPASGLPQDETNLAHQAAVSFLAATGIASGIEIILHKKIPVAAGLGGGSSDAAAVLLGMNRLLQAGLEPEELLDLACPLGADVPFFVSPLLAARATGIGDRLQAAEGVREGSAIVLVNPGFPVSTRWVYENFALTSKNNTYMLGRELIHDRDPASVSRESLALFNDLETVTLKHFPEVERLKSELLAGGALGALMSGSGPTVFGLFRDRSLAAQSVAALKPKFGKNVFLTGPRSMVL